MKEEKMLNNKENGKYEKKTLFRERILIAQNSVLTDLFARPEFKVVRPFCFIIFILSLVQNVLTYQTNDKSTTLFVNFITAGFARIRIAFVIWFCMLCVFLALYPAFVLWAKIRNRFPPKSAYVKLWDYASFTLFVLYYLSFLAMLPCLRGANIGIACATALVIEQMRMMMKMYAFVRSNVPRVLSHKNDSKNNILVPSVGKFLYFIFAPTLLYRDEYPRTKVIRWSFIFINLGELVLCSVYASHLIPYAIVPEFAKYGLEYQSALNMITSIIAVTIPSIIIFTLGFYLLFHCWFNATAELLHFGDRLFYKDWWNASSFIELFRKWNLPVYDFLQAYVYKDLRTICGENKNVAIWILFLISGSLHDYTVAMIYNFYCPVLFGEYLVLGLIFSCKGVNKVISTRAIFVLCVLAANSIAVGFIMFELRARANCQQIYMDPVANFFMPRFWTCNEALMNNIQTNPI